MSQYHINPFGLSQPHFRPIYTNTSPSNYFDLSPLQLAKAHQTYVPPTPFNIDMPIIGDKPRVLQTPPSAFTAPTQDKEFGKPKDIITEGDPVLYSKLIQVEGEFNKIEWSRLTADEKRTHSIHRATLNDLKANRNQAGGNAKLDRIIAWTIRVLDYQETAPAPDPGSAPGGVYQDYDEFGQPISGPAVSPGYSDPVPAPAPAPAPAPPLPPPTKDGLDYY